VRIRQIAFETESDRLESGVSEEAQEIAESAVSAQRGAVGFRVVKDWLPFQKHEIFRILRLPFGCMVTIRCQNLCMRRHSSKEIPFHCVAAVVPFLMAGALTAQDSGDGSGLANKEVERRLALVQEGQMLLSKGDEAYKAGKFKEASEAFAGARSAFPDAPTTAELREAATRRFILASVEYGRELSRQGDVAGAKAVIDKVLDDSVAPDDSYAIGFRAELDDPIRTNPALTKEHAADVDQVRRLLYTAQGAFDLGKFDEARNHYKEVLRIDPYNVAAEWNWLTRRSPLTSALPAITRVRNRWRWLMEHGSCP
jgi:tetratricopeptide (TPR) repeat protein